MASLVELKREQQKRVAKALEYSDLDWNHFLLTFKEPHIRLLEVVYWPEPKTVMYRHAYRAFRQINYSERSARRLIHDLGQRGLLIHFTSTFGVIKPVRELTSNVHALIRLYRARQHSANPVQEEYYDEIAKLILEDEGWPPAEDGPGKS